MGKFKYGSIVRLNKDACLPNNTITILENTDFIYLGDIVQIPDHCILINMSTNEILTGYHTDNFRLATEDEI